eukprot:370226-Rhodomonas_salina.1
MREAKSAVLTAIGFCGPGRGGSGFRRGSSYSRWFSGTMNSTNYYEVRVSGKSLVLTKGKAAIVLSGCASSSRGKLVYAPTRAVAGTDVVYGPTRMGIRLAWGAFLSILCLNFGPLADVLDLYFLEVRVCPLFPALRRLPVSTWRFSVLALWRFLAFAVCVVAFFGVCHAHGVRAANHVVWDSKC